MAKVITLFTLSISLIALLVLHLALQNVQTTKNIFKLNLHNTETIKIAVLADLHIDSLEDLSRLKETTSRINEAKPDLIALLGDYSSTGYASEFRTPTLEVLSNLEGSPKVAVLGNHDNSIGRNAWISGFNSTEILLLENQSALLFTGAGPICVRGFGDLYSKKLRRTEWISECEKIPKLNITHDPAGAFRINEPGFYLSGHTHCGQIRLPLLGALFVPSEVPRGARCGHYESSKFHLWVSSGIGTSVIDFRLGTRSEWDLLELSFDAMK